MKRHTRALALTVLALMAATQIQAAGTYITGKVMSSSNKPLSSVWVMVAQNGVEKGRSLTGDDGTYFIGNLKEGTYSILVKDQGRQLFRGQVQLPRDKKHDVRVP